MKKFKEYILQGIGIYVGFMIASICLAITIFLGVGVVRAVSFTTASINRSIRENNIEKQLLKEQQLQEKKAKAELEAKQQIELESEKFLTEQATGEIIFEKEGSYTLKVKEGTGNINIIKDKGSSTWINMKPGDIKIFEAEKGNKIILAENMHVIWGLNSPK